MSGSHHQNQVKGSLSVECYKSGTWKLIGQFCQNVIGCQTQVAFVGNGKESDPIDASANVSADASVDTSRHSLQGNTVILQLYSLCFKTINR